MKSRINDAIDDGTDRLQNLWKAIYEEHAGLRKHHVYITFNHKP